MHRIKEMDGMSGFDSKPRNVRSMPSLERRLEQAENDLRNLGRMLHEGQRLKSTPVTPDSVVAAARHKSKAAQAMEKGDGVRAEAEARAAMALCPDSAEVVFALARALHESGQLPEAEARYRQAIVVAPKYASAWFNMGDVLHLLNQEQEALAAWHMAATLGHEGARKKVAAQGLEKPTTHTPVLSGEPGQRVLSPRLRS
ncbi:MAG: tetratricopeptide repeat protein, partial [Magnetococcales bacterium]|nr:tetratricopeptide repeat protein [Magnetococcales bacterium]